MRAGRRRGVRRFLVWPEYTESTAVTWIRTFAPGEATGRLAKLYEEAVRRAGKVFGIVRAMSPQPRTLETSMAFYSAVMLGRSPLTRRQREMLGVVVSRANDCHY